jgi:NADPH:quinone reductase-like Zn-dependent oxidoreductase
LIEFGAFAEYINVPTSIVIPVPSVSPAAISLLVSGLTASISLEEVGQMKNGETVLVTGT